MFWCTFLVILIVWSKNMEEFFSFINSSDTLLHQEPEKKMFNFKNLIAILL